MKEGWEIHDLGTLIDIQNGFAFDAKFFGSSGMPLIRIRDLKRGNTTSTKYSGKYDNSFVVTPGDLLVGMDGEFKCYEWNGPSALLNQRVCRLIVNSAKLERKFLLYGINTYLEEIERITAYTTVKHISSKQIKAIKFPLPPLSEQQRIVRILDAAFAQLDRAKELTERNLANAKALFESYLDEVFTKRGEGWEERRLGEVALEFGRGKSKHRPRNDPKLYGGPYPFIQTGDVRNSNHYISSYSQTYSELGLSQSKLWPKGTLCITIAANIAETGILTFDACFPDSVIGFVENPGFVKAEFVEYAINHFKSTLQELGKGSAQDNINLATFESVTFPIPSVSEQITILQKLQELSGYVQSLSAFHAKRMGEIESLRQSLLHQAFTGDL